MYSSNEMITLNQYFNYYITQSGQLDINLARHRALELIGEHSDTHQVQILFYFKTYVQLFNIQILPFLWKDKIQILLQIFKPNPHKELQRLRELDEYKNKLLANVSHDLRTPLNAIIFTLNQLKNKFQSSKEQKSFSIAQTNCFFLMNLINDILDYCLWKNNKIRLNITQFSIQGFLDELSEIIKYSTKLKKIKLIVKNQISNCQNLVTDQKRLSQILINLLSNSIKFTSHGSVSLIASNSKNNQLITFCVQDTGSGIKQEIISQLGQPFATFGNQANENATGIGLGLSLSKQFLPLLGPNKHFQIETEIGKGSSFSFTVYQNYNQKMDFHSEISINSQYLDCEDILNGSENIESQSSSSELSINNIYIIEQKTQQFANINILIADDNIFNIFVMKKSLKMINQNFVTFSSNNGQEAVEMFKIQNEKNNKDNFQLIIMDCDMPVMDGFEATRAIRSLIQNQLYQKVIIIGSTALLTEEENIKGINSGMELMIPKPIDQNSLILIIEQLLKIEC